MATKYTLVELQPCNPTPTSLTPCPVFCSRKITLLETLLESYRVFKPPHSLLGYTVYMISVNLIDPQEVGEFYLHPLCTHGQSAGAQLVNLVLVVRIVYLSNLL